MCAVSEMVNYFDRSKPIETFARWKMPPEPVAPPVWDRESFELLKRAMAILEKLDAKLGEPECGDPKKVDFLKRIEERLQALEAKQ